MDNLENMGWTVYIMMCGDESLYTGITTDLDRRLKEHKSGRGAKYTKGRGPFRIVYSENFNTRAEATKMEANVKALKRNEKLSMVSDRA